MKTIIDEIAARELELYAVNDSEIYFKSLSPIDKNLARKVKKGIFDHGKAVKAFLYTADFAAKKYCQEFGGIWYQVFNKATREAVAKNLVESFLTDFDYR